MPPKRRKLSVGTLAADAKDGETACHTERDSVAEQDLVTPVQTSESMETGATKLACSPEAKLKDDALKPTRISKRLIIKRSRFVDEDPKEKEHVKPARQATPRKPRSTSSARQTKQAGDSTKSKGQKVYVPWNLVDKRMFFQGLQQYGKNFEAISKKVSQAAKLKGSVPKDKFQVQYFYYRVWRKIAKFVDMKGADVPMKTQELYGLINYGVLSKHVKENDPSFGQCLNNLIHHGHTAFVRKGNHKNKCGKLRTPVCTCLKKINRIIDINETESTSSQKLPQTVSIELTPKNSKAWAKVQSVSQNPRLRVKLASNRTVESVIKFLMKKWKPPRVKNREKLGVLEESKENLAIFLHPNSKIVPVTLVAHQHKKIDITFSSYRQKILPLLQNEMLQMQNEKKSRTMKETDKGAGTEKDKFNSELNPEQGNFNFQAQSSAFTFSDSSHSQKSEEKLTLIIPENKCQDVDSPLLGTPNGLSDAGEGCSSKTFSARDKLLNSPKRPRTPSVILEDENAMFPDSAGSFSPTSSSSLASSLQQSKSPDASLSPRIMTQQPSMGASTEIASPSLGRRRRANNRNPKNISTLTPDPSHPVAPATGNENNSTSSTSPAKLQDCPGPPSSELQSDPQQDETLLGLGDSQKEISRLTQLATEEGLTALNAQTVTLLHLSLLLGRETLLRLQYEWRERRPVRGAGSGLVNVNAGLGGAVSIPPILGQAAGQMSNLLRRLCNLATLELTDFVHDSELKTIKTSSGGTCSRCSASMAATTAVSHSTSTSVKVTTARTRRQSLLNRAELENERQQEDGESNSTVETKETGIQTDPPPQIPFPFPAFPPPGVHVSQSPGNPTTVHVPGNVQVLQQGSVLTAGGRTFVAPTPTAAQGNGGDPVFRVPLIPAFRDAVRAEQLKQEEQRRLQEKAKTILEQGSNQRRLLKKRRVINKKKKEPPLIVQRTLMPKLDSAGIVTYIQPTISPVSNAMLYNLNPVEEMAPQTVSFQSQPPATKVSVTPGVELPKQNDSRSAEKEDQTSNENVDILKKAVLSAEIDINVSPIKDDRDETKTFGPLPLSGEVTTTENGAHFDTVSMGSNCTVNKTSDAVRPSLQSDISMSEFDISLSGMPVSSMGPDAGDKFLDLVLQNSEQGFSGLLSTPKKSSNLSAALPLFPANESPASTTTYNPSTLRTPTHFGTSSSSIGLITPIKLDLDQEWVGPLAAGDISLSSILGDSSSFRTNLANSAQKSPDTGPSLSLASRPAVYSEQTDLSSSDGFMKHNVVTELSFSSLLGDPSFKKDDDSTCGLSPPLSSSANPSISLPSPALSMSGANPATSLSGPPERGKGQEDGRSSVNLFSEVSQDSFSAKLDVDGALHGIMASENSLDLVSKFEALAGGTALGQGLSADHQDIPGAVAEDAALATSLGPLAITCREGTVDSHVIKLESPSAI
ncbi:protein cramped-like protein [Plakobranchus ocellatus]|uniref:Protein cramped-like protein n=1 Tax=Plakobranchus ocellatus TaxID=259542 RepID=A0AAV3YYX2_9GAST|nr:protein cramped-like protein [Plakobranchus ocellatus]